jgi:hypothetical protein
LVRSLATVLRGSAGLHAGALGERHRRQRPGLDQGRDQPPFGAGDAVAALAEADRGRTAEPDEPLQLVVQQVVVLLRIGESARSGHDGFVFNNRGVRA